MAIRNRLLSTFSHGSPACGVTASACLNVTPNYPLERAIRITLIIFTLLSMSITGRVRAVKIMTRCLRQQLTILRGAFLMQSTLSLLSSLPPTEPDWSSGFS